METKNQVQPKQGASTKAITLALVFIAAIVVPLLLVPYSKGYVFYEFSILQHLIRFQEGGFTGLYFEEGGKWQHGMIVLPLVIALGWATRKRFQIDPKQQLYLQLQQNWLGLLLLLFGLLLWYAGIRVNVRYVGFASIQIVLAGVILWFMGWNWFKQIGPLWVLIAFAWPIPAFDSTISFQLRIWSAEFAAKFLELVQIPVIQAGTGLVSMPDPEKGLELGELFQVGVAGPCSGMKALMMLLMMSLVYGYLFHQKLWQRIGLFLVAFPLALLANTVRVSLLVLGTIWFGKDFAIGESEANPSAFHMGAGLLVFAIVLAGLVTISAIMRRQFSFWKKEKVVLVKRDTEEKSAEVQAD